LFYNELGGVAGQSITTTRNANYGLFQNIQSNLYWSGTDAPPDANYAWIFGFNDSSEGAGLKTGTIFAWAVQTGDVAAVPVPTAVWLFGSGLLGLVGVARRKKVA
jgi:hypothetical protein